MEYKKYILPGVGGTRTRYAGLVMVMGVPDLVGLPVDGA